MTSTSTVKFSSLIINHLHQRPPLAVITASVGVYVIKGTVDMRTGTGNQTIGGVIQLRQAQPMDRAAAMQTVVEIGNAAVPVMSKKH